jgi:hypothetical protein
MRALLSVLLLTSMLVAQPISLHPENPHYLLYKGEPTVLVTSAEHYGAVLNLDFDYQTYLRTLAAYDLNYTRIFTGNYFEDPTSFGIERNTLAPKRVMTPWKKIPVSGNKQDSVWTINPVSMLQIRSSTRESKNGKMKISLPDYPDEWAVRIVGKN